MVGQSRLRPSVARTLVRAAVMLMLILSHGASFALAQRAPVSPDHPWHGLAEARIESDAKNLPQSTLSFDPEKRVAWERARAQAAAWGIARSELYPTVAAAALAGVDREQAYLTNRFFRQTIGDFHVALNLNYTILDFGGRAGRIDAAKADA